MLFQRNKNMISILSIGFGGALGAISRFWLSNLVNNNHSSGFPYGTMTVNLIGSLLIGVLWGIFEHFDIFPSSARLFLITGFLGAFTTFSTFSLEIHGLITKSQIHIGLFYALISLAGGLLMVFLGFSAVSALK
jgi:fluoride exporter